MERKKRVLFVCEGNIHRSPTAERLYSHSPGLKVRSAGLSSLARVQLVEELLTWADLVLVMERRLQKMLRRRFPLEMQDKEMVCLNDPDEYQFLQTELVAILTERLTPILGLPIPDPLQ